MNKPNNKRRKESQKKNRKNICGINSRKKLK